MKIIYSHLKKFLPDLHQPVREAANTLTMLGHFADGLTETEGQEIISLEIRQNRGDCLGYYGIAKDLSVYYSLPLKIFSTKLNFGSAILPIEVKAHQEVKRLQALKISGLKNTPTPNWLKQFLELHSINSINTLVDLTNFIMLWYGIPCHAFDTQKSSDHLIWELSKKPEELVTLDGTKLALPIGTLQISNAQGPVCLSMIGGQSSGIELQTTETLIEMAVYDRVRVRKDARNLKVITEAGSRLEKDLDQELMPQAFSHLASIIIELCGGKITTQLFDYYPKRINQPQINFEPKNPAVYAGINIPEKFSLDCLDKLGCQIEKNNQSLTITPPTIRKDLELEEDLIEEVIRFYGYEKIPTNEPINPSKLSDITPKILYLISQIKNILISLGYDEIRSWPLIEEKFLLSDNLSDKAKPIYTQNNINANFPVLRTSIISSLLGQKDQYERLKVDKPHFFEIGKIFYQINNDYQEHYSLGIYQPDGQKLWQDLQNLAKSLQFDVSYFQKIVVEDEVFYEANLEKMLNVLTNIKPTLLDTPEKSEAVVELTKQIIALDANILLKEKIEPEKLLNKYKNLIGPEKLWQIEIKDIFNDKNGFKYTFRVSYFNLTDKEAKKIHKKTFGL